MSIKKEVGGQAVGKKEMENEIKYEMRKNFLTSLEKGICLAIMLPIGL
jgi:hypothetical protein